MAVLFNITVPSNTLTLDAKRSGQITFTVASTSNRSLVGLAQISASDPSMASWFQLEPGAERRGFESHQTVQYVVTVQAPATAPPQDYTFHLIVAEESNPDDNFTNSPDIKFTVPAQAVVPTKKPFPWWIVAVAAAILIVIIAIIVIVSVNNNNQANANATATARANAVTQTSAFLSAQGATQTTEFLGQQAATQTAQFFASQTASAVFATQTQAARPTPTFTPRPPATISLTNNGAFVARVSVSYNLNGSLQNQTTDSFPVGVTQSVVIPGDARGVLVQIQDFTGFNWRDACGAFSFDIPTNKSYSVSGTTLITSCSGG